MSASAHCIFCKIVRGEIPAINVYEDEHTLAFMDIQPASPGHTLVIAKAHASSLLDIAEDTFEDGTLYRAELHPMVRWYARQFLPPPDEALDAAIANTVNPTARASKPRRSNTQNPTTAPGGWPRTWVGYPGRRST